MGGMPDWTVWILAAGIVLIFIWFFWDTARTLYQVVRRLVGTIQNWPQVRRDMTEAEARSGGRYPVWYRAIRVLLVLAMIGLGALLVWRKIAGA